MRAISTVDKCFPFRRFFSVLSLLAGLLLVALGVLAIVGYRTQCLFLVQPHPICYPLSPWAAIGLMVRGVGTLASVPGWQRWTGETPVPPRSERWTGETPVPPRSAPRRG